MMKNSEDTFLRLKSKKVCVLPKLQSTVAKRFGSGKQTVYYGTKRLLEKKKRDRLPAKLCLEALRRDIEEHPDAYQHERAKRFGVSQNCISKITSPKLHLEGAQTPWNHV
jgi:transposase